MPELPEVENILTGLAPLVINKTITDVTFSDAIQQSHHQGKQTIIKGLSLDEFCQKIKNFQINNLIRRGKYLIFSNENGVMINHLGMTGAWFVVNDIMDIPVNNYRKHWHIQFKLNTGEQLIFSDIRRFGEMRYLENLNHFKPLKEMAPEPFDQTALMHFLSKIKDKKYYNKAIKPLIMTNELITGCGNIYACEALYLARINPHQQIKYMTQHQLIDLFGKICLVLKQGIENGGTTISDYRDVYGSLGSNQYQLNVYGKNHCPQCHNDLSHDKIANRMSHYCSDCQPLISEG